MKREDAIEFLKLVSRTIQTNHLSPKDAEKAMCNLLEETDRLHIELTGEPIVKRTTEPYRTILEIVAGYNPLDKIKTLNHEQQGSK